MSLSIGSPPGANNQLSNLSATAINTALIPSTNANKNLGSTSLLWGQIFVDSARDTSGVAQISFSARQLNDSGSNVTIDWANKRLQSGGLGTIIASWTNTEFVSNISFGMAGSTSGQINQKANATTSSYTVTWPSAQGTGALTNDGSGNLTWTAGGAGANTTLSNLTSPTAINQDLIFNKSSALIETKDAAVVDTNSENLSIQTGTATGIGASGTVSIESGTIVDGASGSVFLRSGIPTGSGGSGDVEVSTGAPSANGTSGTVNILSGPSSSGPATGGVNISTGDAGASGASTGSISFITGSSFDSGGGNFTFSAGTSTDASANATGGGYFFDAGAGGATGGSGGGFNFTSGNAPAGTGGQISFTTGTGLTRGKIQLKNGSEGTTGHVWTSTDTSGSGSWQAAASGFDPGIYGDGSDGAATLNGTNTVTWAQLMTQWTFTVTTARVYAGDIYTNNGQTFIVKTTSSGTSVVTYGTGTPSASGTLTATVLGANSGQGVGTITFSTRSNTTATNAYLVTRTPYLTNLTLNSGTTLWPNWYAIRGTGALTVNSGAIIANNGGVGLPGGIAAGVVTQGQGGFVGNTNYGTPGAGALTTHIQQSPPWGGELGSGAATSGGALGTVASAGTAGNDSGVPSAWPGGLGGNSGAGGAGASGAGGTGGFGLPIAGLSPAYLGRFVMPALVVGAGQTPQGGPSGATGGSGGGDASNPGGGGGSGGGGGGVMALYFATIANSGVISCNGGNGGAGETVLVGNTGGGGGGGGGAGGLIYCVTNTFSGAGTYTVTAGTAGAAGVKAGTGVNGVAGSAGNVGRVLKYQTSTRTWI